MGLSLEYHCAGFFSPTNKYDVAFIFTTSLNSHNLSLRETSLPGFSRGQGSDITASVSGGTAPRLELDLQTLNLVLCSVYQLFLSLTDQEILLKLQHNNGIPSKAH